MATNTQNSVQGPFCFIPASVKDSSVVLFAVLIPQCILLYITQSYRSLLLIFVSVCASVCAELLTNVITKQKTMHDGTAIAEGVIAGMFLPYNFPLIPAFIIFALSFSASKQIFGGLANSWVNPVVVAVASAFCCGSQFFPPFLLAGAAVNPENLYAGIFKNGIHYISTDSSITTTINDILISLGITLPEGYITLFWDTQSHIPAFRFNALTLLASTFLIAYKITKWLIPLTFIFTYAFLVRLFSLLPITGIVGQGDMLFALLSGGVLFTAFFILCGYGTIPFSILGQICYGFFAGCLCFCLNGYGSSSIGVIFSVLVINILSPVIQLFEKKLYIINTKHFFNKGTK